MIKNQSIIEKWNSSWKMGTVANKNVILIDASNSDPWSQINPKENGEFFMYYYGGRVTGLIGINIEVIGLMVPELS